VYEIIVIAPLRVINDAKSAAVTGLFDAMALIDFAHAKATIKSMKNINSHTILCSLGI
jgi:hypothetical protein